MASRPRLPTLVRVTRFAAAVLALALACAACNQGSTPGGQPGGAGGPAGGPPNTASEGNPSDLRFTITFTFDSRASDQETWHEGSFTTTGSLTADVIDHLGQARGAIGVTWPGSGSQRFRDVYCHTPDECLELCIGSYAGSWQDTPNLAIAERSGGHIVLDLQLMASPKANDDAFLTDPHCPAVVNGGLDEMPPMHITIDGLGSGHPTFSAEPYSFDENDPGPGPGDVWKLEIAPA
jgi:hypothetical protein